ncbi:hypothetical protein DENSPDRAFT_838569 [Dentipellis sp. KUC8613]|nr:hypothetical protein DENSPDRAFT_838569 [Dentipellis sp. KUC8613]
MGMVRPQCDERTVFTIWNFEPVQQQDLLTQKAFVSPYPRTPAPASSHANAFSGSGPVPYPRIPALDPVRPVLAAPYTSA